MKTVHFHLNWLENEIISADIDKTNIILIPMCDNLSTMSDEANVIM